MVFERIRLRRSEAGTEEVEKTDSEGSRLRFFADSKLDLNVPPGELGGVPEEVISTQQPKSRRNSRRPTSSPGDYLV